jgi:glycosyltransferase involved in cell wall biosynthesis
MNHEISTIISVYNEGKYIDECIKSLLAQIFKQIKIVFAKKELPDKFNAIESIKATGWEMV